MLQIINFFKPLLVIIIFCFFFSCKDSNNSTSGIEGSIPSDATSVLLINTKQLMEKADFDALLETSLYQEFLKKAGEESPESIHLFKDPQSAGIDLSSNMGLYISIINKEGESEPEFALILPISDKEKIEKTLASALNKENKIKVQDKGAYQLINLDDDLNLIHNEKIIAFVNFEDETKINKILNPSGDNIKSNANFNKHLKEGKDIMFWMQTDEIVATTLSKTGKRTESELKGVFDMLQITPDVLKENYMSFYYDFKKGEIDAGTSLDFNDELVDAFGDFFPSKLAIDYSKYIPADNLAFAMSFGINPSGIIKYLAKIHFDILVENYMSMLDSDLNLAKIKDGITGDMAFGIYAPQTKGSDPSAVVALGLKDKSFIEGLIEKYGMFAGITKDGNNYVINGGQSMDADETPNQIIISIQNEVLLVSNSIELLEKAKNGNQNEIVAEMQNGWLGTFLNYAIIENHHDDISSFFPIDDEILGLTKILQEYNELEDVKILLKGTHIDIKTDLKTKDINSLKRLIQIAEKLYQNRDKIKAEIEKNLKTDEFDGEDEEGFFNTENI